MPVNRYTASANLTAVYRYIRSITLTEVVGTAAVKVQFTNGNDTTNDVTLFGLTAAAGQTVTYAPAKPLYFSKGVRLNVIASAPFTGSPAVTIDGY